MEWGRGPAWGENCLSLPGSCGAETRGGDARTGGGLLAPCSFLACNTPHTPLRALTFSSLFLQTSAAVSLLQSPCVPSSPHSHGACQAPLEPECSESKLSPLTHALMCKALGCPHILPSLPHACFFPSLQPHVTHILKSLWLPWRLGLLPHPGGLRAGQSPTSCVSQAPCARPSPPPPQPLVYPFSGFLCFSCSIRSMGQQQCVSSCAGHLGNC